MSLGIKLINNQVVGKITSLPSNWETGDFQNRFLPVEEVNANYNPTTQIRTGPSYEIQTDKVIATYTVEDRNLDDVKADRKTYIESKRDIAENEDIVYGGKTYQCDEKSRSALNIRKSTTLETGDLPADFKWINKDNSKTTFGVADIKDLGLAMANRSNEVFIKARDLKDQIDVATTINEVMAIDW